MCKQEKNQQRKFDNYKTIRYNKLKVYYDYYLTIIIRIWDRVLEL